MTIDIGVFQKFKCIGPSVGYHIIQAVVAAAHRPDNGIHLTQQIVGIAGNLIDFRQGIAFHLCFYNFTHQATGGNTRTQLIMHIGGNAVWPLPLWFLPRPLVFQFLSFLVPGAGAPFPGSFNNIVAVFERQCH